MYKKFANYFCELKFSGKYSPKTLVLEGVIPLETFPLAEWHEGELADVPRFTVLKTQICVTRPQCGKIRQIQFLP